MNPAGIGAPTIRGALAAGLMALAAGAAMAQNYPSKPVRLVVPFPGGSSTDVIMRVIMEPVREQLGQPLIIDPKPGSGAVLASQYVMSQPPDGYTLMVSTSSQTIASAAPKPAYDVRRMTHIVHYTGGPVFLAVNAEKVPAKSLKELIEFVRARPGQINFSSYGAGSLGHLAAELFNQVANVKTVSVPYKGSPANVLAIATGESHMGFDVMTFIAPQIQAGKLRVIAASTSESSPDVPEVPGMKAAGLPEFNVLFWQGISGPEGLPRDIVMKVNGAFNFALKHPNVIEYMTKVRALRFGGTPEALTEIVNREVDVWGKLIRTAGIELN